MRIIETAKEYKMLPKSVVALFFARIINSIGSFVFPFLTLFLTEKIGMKSDRAGRFMLLAALAIAAGSIIGGKLSDKIGRKKTILIFQAMAAIMLVPCGFLGESMMITWLLVVSSFFSGAVQPASSAMVADLTTKENRQQAFSLLYLGMNIGVAIGPLIAGILYRKYIEWIFWGDAITTLIALVLVAFFVEESIPNNMDYIKEDDEKGEDGTVISVILRRPSLLIFSFVSLIYSFAYAQSNFIIPLQVEKLFPSKGPLYFGSLMSINAIVVVLFTMIIIDITKKNQPIFNITLSGIFYAVGFGMLYYVTSYYFLVISTIIWTIGEILATTNQGVYIANHTPMSHRGRVNSILPLISGAGYAIGPTVMGYYIKNRDIIMAWPIVAILSILAALFMYFLYLKDRKKSL